MKVLVLGGTGAIGMELVSVLEKRGMKLDITSRSERKSEKVNYICGNAQDDIFLQRILQNEYDVIVDFMNYTTEKFAARVDIILNATKQYIFLSSARVYADSDYPIQENSRRIIDISGDNEYLKTDEYALAKARQEDILLGCDKKNWTIVRPYITYNNERLQLGFFEKEAWLYRALQGRTIVFTNDIAQRYTTLTYGGDVAKGIADLVGNKEVLSNIYNIMQNENIQWCEVLEIYLRVLTNINGKRPKVIMLKDSTVSGKVSGRTYQIEYDRLYNRIFSNNSIRLHSNAMDSAITAEKGLSRCLINFMEGDREFENINWKYEGYADKMVNEHTPLGEIKGIKNKIRYLLARYTKYFEK